MAGRTFAAHFKKGRKAAWTPQMNAPPASHFLRVYEAHRFVKVELVTVFCVSTLGPPIAIARR